MIRTLATWAIALMLIALFVAEVTQGGTRPAQERVVPACEEDAVLIGAGDFEHGRWSAYECGPAVDDYR